MKNYAIILCALFISLMSCETEKGEDTPVIETDKQVRLEIFSMNPGSSSAYSEDIIIGDLIRFNKNYWSNVDSIIFVANFGVGEYSEEGTSAFTATAELYDKTNEQVIEGSSVSTNSTIVSHISSSNVYDNLPDEEITLGIKFSIDNEGEYIGISGTSYLFIYKN